MPDSSAKESRKTGSDNHISVLEDQLRKGEADVKEITIEWKEASSKSNTKESKKSTGSKPATKKAPAAKKKGKTGPAKGSKRGKKDGSSDDEDYRSKSPVSISKKSASITNVSRTVFPPGGIRVGLSRPKRSRDS